MHDILIVAIAAIGGVFVGLTVLIVANKAWREAVAGYRRARRRVLEPRILSFIHGDEASLRETAGGLVPFKDRTVVEMILLDHAQRVRGIERERLARALDDLGYVDRYIEGLGSRWWWKRADAAEKLGLAGARRATEHLAKALNDDISEVRIRAAKSLGVVGGPASARPLIRALNEPNRWSTIRIADILTSMGQEVVQELLGMFDELSPPGKLAAMDIVGRVRSVQVKGWVEERLEDPEPDVRARACHALGQIGDPNAGPVLVKMLQDPQWPVRAMAAKALGKLRFSPAIPALCNRLRDSEWWARSNAAESLRLMGPKGIEALERMLDDQDTYAQHQAVLMLQESGEVDRRVGMLAREDDAEREAAESLLRRLVKVGQTARLFEIAGEHPDLRVREALGSLLVTGGADGETPP